MNFHRGTTDVSVQLGIVPYVRGHTCKRTHQGRIYMYIRPRYIPTHLFHFKVYTGKAWYNPPPEAQTGKYLCMYITTYLYLFIYSCISKYGLLCINHPPFSFHRCIGTA